MSETAAFFRVEGALSPRPTLQAAATIAANAQHVGERLVRVGNVALAAPFLLGGPLKDATVGNRVAWMGLRGISEDRLVILARDYFENVLRPRLREVGVELVAQAKREGRHVVLLSDNLDVVIRPLAKHLDVEHIVCNRMEIRDAKCTGRLLDPVIAGHVAAEEARAFASAHGIALERSFAYGAKGDDGLLLAAIGKPCAIHPDRELRKLARDLDWPVVER